MSEDIRQAPPYPKTVVAAGVLWIIFGCLALLSLLVLLVAAFVLVADVQGAAAAWGLLLSGAVWSAVPIGLIGAALIGAGSQSIRGTARDTLGSGIGSIILGLIYWGVAAIAVMVEWFIPAGVAGLVGALLLTAGVLALAGRSGYKLWRKAYKLD